MVILSRLINRKFQLNLIFIMIFISTVGLVAAQEKHWKAVFWEDFQNADAELNRVYKLVMKKIEDSSLPSDVIAKWREQQRNAQRAWIKFRDEDSKVVEYIYWRGMGVPQAELSWKSHLTKKRIDDLKLHYEIK